MAWKHLDTGKRLATENMALDAALLMDLKDEQDPILHLYDWEEEALTYGYFIDPENFLNMKNVETRGLDLAKRPTGGELSFTIVTLPSPSFCRRPILISLKIPLIITHLSINE